IEIYLRYAFTSELPLLVRSQLDTIKGCGADVFKCAVIVPDQHNPPTRYAIRLGNESYPHMKLVIELAPNNEKFLFRADTHDRHVCPSSRSPEYIRFCQLMEKNQKMAESIEFAWENEGLPTFRAYLREDLRRRQSMQI
ncbi:MAG: hypothetical protein JO353_01720, partial [Phycisphaerae bacterium]|nr:hypothetical protein [Phycisphaerae bacterium]